MTIIHERLGEVAAWPAIVTLILNDVVKPQF
jgi:hypothetical protein